ncbi:unnamed protein product [Hymenolepis diminuta]|uniref:Single-pass membrane and coiled-coil domain-containing protein 4 n=1 Tax=Hymenolepis diminuta TaxID=6216 RepID=A0A0R3SBA7_HYMDI|nr:unnamed protein product [Hymenolepis diminuta]
MPYMLGLRKPQLFDVAVGMRKLRGGTTKETKKDKLEKRRDKETINEQVFKLVLPTVGFLFLLLVIIVYILCRAPPQTK